MSDSQSASTTSGAAVGETSGAAGEAMASPATPWHAGKATPEDIGLWQNKGWGDADAAAIALAATKAYREAQAFVGFPADRLLKLPAEAGSPEWDAVWAKLGVPTDPKAYDLSNVKFADGTTLTEPAQEFLRAAAQKARVPATALPEFAGAFVKFLEGVDAGETSERTAALQREKASLQQNWGTNYAANDFVARQGAAVLGFTAEDVTALESVVGYARVMEAMRRVGVLNGEDKVVSTGATGDRRVMTREGALARIDELKRDSGFTKRWLSGDREAAREMSSLHEVAYA